MYNVPDQSGRRVVVTGANSGTGFEAAKRLAGAGAEVVLGVRSLEKGEDAAARIRAVHPEARLEIGRVDLASLDSVRAFADEVVGGGRPLHVLVNNAGVMVPPTRMATADGFELQFGTNFLGPFLLTTLLLPTLLNAPAPRVATMSSGTANFGRIRFGDLQWTAGYSASRAYAQSKLADLLLALRLADLAEERGWPLLSTAAHPGYTRTNLQSAGRNLGAGRRHQPRSRTLLPSQTAEQGAEPLLFAAADPAAEQGAYYGPRRWALVGATHRCRLPRAAVGHDLGRSLLAVATSLTGGTLPD